MQEIVLVSVLAGISYRDQILGILEQITQKMSNSNIAAPEMYILALNQRRLNHFACFCEVAFGLCARLRNWMNK